MFGKSKKRDDEPQEKRDERFMIVHEGELDSSEMIFAHTIVFVDKITGVQYVALHENQGVGLTALIDRDGKPLLYKEF